MGRHEVDGLGGDRVRGHGEVAFVLAVLIIHQDDHTARADVFDGVLDPLDGVGVHDREVHGMSCKVSSAPAGPREAEGGQPLQAEPRILSSR